MYKKRMIAILCLVLLSGCKQISSDDDYVSLVYNCFSTDTMTNNVSQGYKYYIPKGVIQLKDFNYNQSFLIEDNYLYLYVDVISYFYQKKLNVAKHDNVYYYQPFEFDNKVGYILILTDDNLQEYYLSIVYNYSKIEGYVKKDKLNKVITLSSIILNSIEYNDVVIEKILDGDLGQFSEFTYEVDKPEGSSSNFSQYLEENVQKEDDEDNIEQLPGE